MSQSRYQQTDTQDTLVPRRAISTSMFGLESSIRWCGARRRPSAPAGGRRPAGASAAAAARGRPRAPCASRGARPRGGGGAGTCAQGRRRGCQNGARLGQSCAGDARDAAPRGSQACSWPPMCGTRCVPAAVPRQNPPSAICYRARALAQRWCATPGLSATRRALEAWACLVVPVLTSAAIGAVESTSPDCAAPGCRAPSNASKNLAT